MLLYISNYTIDEFKFKIKILSYILFLIPFGMIFHYFTYFIIHNTYIKIK